MEAIRLEDIVPEGATFSLKKTGKAYRLKPVSLSDELWMSTTFGQGIEEVFKQIKMKDICRIVFHQMEDEDKEDFAAQDVTIMNEEGEKITKRIGGAELLFCMISGYAEKIEIFQALLTTIGVSRPMQKGLSEDQKKNPPQAKNKTGQKSLISSQVNMGGRLKKSSRAQQKKYRTASQESGSAKR